LENGTVNKMWSILFGVTMLACGLSFIIAPWMGWSLPEGVSTHSWDIDFLWYVILYIVGFFFFLTEALLVCFMFFYAGTGGTKPPRQAGWPGALKPLQSVLHDSHRIEMAWTIVPAVILLYIAIAQIDTWASVKYQKNLPKFGTKDNAGKVIPPALQVDISARQFEWRVRYPHPSRMEKWLDPQNASDNKVRDDFQSFAGNPHIDDVHDVNALHLWKDNPTVVYLSTRDVIHSFNIPVMRVKQDALPGKVIPTWFRATRANTALKDGEYVDGVRYEYDKEGKVTKMEHGDRSARWDIPCAELCGWGHYRMIGRVYVHNTREEFMDWLKKQAERDHATTGAR
jgi:cytochrome c oxidase subunit 2